VFSLDLATAPLSLAPPNESKILFVSQESSADIVQEAFRLGALGYVVKTDAGSELLTAVSAVLRGETFASSGIAERNLTGALSLFPVNESLS
jgi:two-component system nitrate/nitrite response regulator NarL